jgi:hypothetical protein
MYCVLISFKKFNSDLAKVIRCTVKVEKQFGIGDDMYIIDLEVKCEFLEEM